MATAVVLSEKDAEVLKRLLDRVRSLPINTTGRGAVPPVEEGFQTADIYVARVPAEGIPAIEEASGVSIRDKPGCADCDIYRIIPSATEVGIPCDSDLQPIYGLSRRVHNFSSSEIAGDTWILTARDKFGYWFAVVGGSGAPETKFVKCLDYEPDADGLYSGRIQDEDEDGTLLDEGDLVWLREANLLEKLEVSKVYHCKLTGSIVADTGTGSGGDADRLVYTAVERKLTVRRSDTTQSFGPDIHTIEFDPPAFWHIEEYAPGIVRVRPAGATVTFQYCDGDGTPHTLVYEYGSLRERS